MEVGVQLAGLVMLVLAGLHWPISHHLRWVEDSQKLSPANRAIFHVHTLFICLVLILMGLPCLLSPDVLLEPTPAGAWIAWSFATFWAIRLVVQWFVFPADLWKGKRRETRIHWVFSIIWCGLTLVFAVCGALQVGWLRH